MSRAQDHGRLVNWASELRRVHGLLREALQLAQDSVASDQASPDPLKDLAVYCRGFCSALDGHHRGEDQALFPQIEAAHPDLAPTLRALQQDHSMIAHLLAELTAVASGTASPTTLARHLDGIAAIMENHFAYEERALLAVLDTLHLDRELDEVLGPLA